MPRNFRLFLLQHSGGSTTQFNEHIRARAPALYFLHVRRTSSLLSSLAYFSLPFSSLRGICCCSLHCGSPNCLRLMLSRHRHDVLATAAAALLFCALPVMRVTAQSESVTVSLSASSSGSVTTSSSLSATTSPSAAASLSATASSSPSPVSSSVSPSVSPSTSVSASTSLSPTPSVSGTPVYGFIYSRGCYSATSGAVAVTQRTTVNVCINMNGPQGVQAL